MRKILYFLTFTMMIFSVLPAFAQQDAQLSQYMFNPLYLNPATAGADGVTRFQLHLRNQWAGYQATYDGGGSLGTQILTASVPLNFIKSGIGLQFANDKTPSGAGYQNVLLSYAYKIGLTNGSSLSIGVRGGFHTSSFDGTIYRPRDPNDPLVDAVSGKKINETQPDFALGAYYNAESFFAGASLGHINSSNYRFGYNGAQNPLKQVLNVNAGYKYYLNDMVEMMPTVLWRTDFSTNSIEGGMIFTYDTKYWIGGSYRAGDAGIVIAGINLLNNSLRLGYSLDLTSNGANAKSPNSHEVLISYSLPAPKIGGKKSIVRTPRFRH